MVVVAVIVVVVVVVVAVLVFFKRTPERQRLILHEPLSVEFRERIKGSSFTLILVPFQ